MDDEGSHNFCTKCGANVHDYDEFCPACGEVLKEGAKPAANRSYNPNSKLPLIKALGGIWAIYAIINGITSIIFIDNMMTMMEDIFVGMGLEYADMWYSMEDFYRMFMLVSGALCLVSGILAVVCTYCCIKKKNHTIALMTCIIGSILVIPSLVGLVGLIVAHFLSKSKPEFES